MAASDAAGPAIEAAFAPFREEGRALLPGGAAVLDAHTHLGLDEDGQSLALDALIAERGERGLDGRSGGVRRGHRHAPTRASSAASTSASVL